MPLFPMGWRRGAAALAVLAAYAGAAAAQDAPTPQRQTQLVRFVRQDCGACHGMRLTGGLGPALTPSALPGRTPEIVSTTILYGHPGTPMPGWRALLSEADARWIAERLLAGFPEEP
jgi:cytochrome c55X